MSNFRFLRAEWPDLHGEAVRAERLVHADPRAACFYARRALELAVKWVFDADGTLRLPYRDDLAGLTAGLTGSVTGGSGAGRRVTHVSVS